MRKGEDIRNEICFDGVEGLNSTQFIREVRSKAFGDDKSDDPKYMAITASLCLDGPAMEWFERLDDNVQTDWSLLRRALLARFPASNASQEETAPEVLIFKGETPKECEDFVRNVRKHSHAEGKTQDDQWTAHYAASCMADDALKWHTKLDPQVRNSWIQLERALLTYFPAPPPYGLATAGRILVERWEPTEAPSFLPTNEGAWLREARERRAAYDKAGPERNSSARWVLVEGGANFPDKAINTGKVKWPLFCARTWYDGGLIPGMTYGGPGEYPAFIPYGGGEVTIGSRYEVLVGDPSAVRWVSNPWNSDAAANVGPVRMKGFHAVEGGRARDGTALFLAQALVPCGSGWQPGRVVAPERGCQIGICGKTYVMSQFRILVWAE